MTVNKIFGISPWTFVWYLKNSACLSWYIFILFFLTGTGMCKSWSTGVQIQHSDSTATAKSWDNSRFGGYYEGATYILLYAHKI